MAGRAFLLLVLCCCLVDVVQAHGRLVDPPSRNAMWMYGFPNKANYNLNELNCGGTKNHWEVQGGKCGLCGDPYQGPRKHEAGYIGGYANGIIGRVYKEGQTIPVRVDVTANHFGWFEFSLCPSNGQPVTQQCFNRYKLSDARGQTRHRLQPKLQGYKGTVNFNLRLPTSLICSQCVLQWFWFAGNSRDRIPQETFVNCADVVITRRDETLDGGLVMPNILPQAHQPIPENNHTLGYGTLIGLTGEWDCEVPPPYNGAKRRVYKEWCLENCLYALPHQRSCPVETCRCYRTDKLLGEAEERRLLNIKDEYPVISSRGNPVNRRTAGTLEGTWECEVVSPFSRTDYIEWCRYHCLEALPNERDCPASHCRCWRTDKRLTRSEEARLLLPVRSQQTNQSANPAPSSSPANSTDWKRKSKISSRPNGLNGSWDCDVVSPYNVESKRLHYYEWCLGNCVNAAPSDRFCPEDMCDCHRTDVRHSKDQLRAQLEGGQVQTHDNEESSRRGIPPSLVDIINYSNSLRSGNGQRPSLQGEWDCEVVLRIPHKVGADEKRSQLHTWCLDMCIKPQPNDRYCPDTHCRCYRTDITQSDAENRRQLETGVSAVGIIHSESGENGTLENDDNRPYLGGGGGTTEATGTSKYTCEAVAPFNTGSQGRETLKYCYDSCVHEVATQRNCPKSHCRCFETDQPQNVLRTAQSTRRPPNPVRRNLRRQQRQQRARLQRKLRQRKLRTKRSIFKQAATVR